MKTLFAIAGVIMSLNIQSANADCPDHFQGEYRKLHSSQNIALCPLVQEKVTLVVNTASHCGFTKQFGGLEALYQQYKEKGLVIVGFASDDFNQESKDEGEAAGICFENFGVTFTMIAPTHVKGKQANNLFKYLNKESGQPKWNFNKYLVGKDGKVIKHFNSETGPDDKDLKAAIEKALAQ